MELIAAIRGLEALTTRRRVRVYSDSQYLVRGMSEWLQGWIRSGRINTPDALKNQDLWQQLAALSAGHDISWEWIRGHDGHYFNERCDRLAKRAAEAGMRAAEEELLAAAAAEQVEESVREVQTFPLPVTSDCEAVDEIREEVVFETDDDGQLLLLC